MQGRSWQSPQGLKTPDHSAVARLKNELQDERKKLQVLACAYSLDAQGRVATAAYKAYMFWHHFLTFAYMRSAFMLWTHVNEVSKPGMRVLTNNAATQALTKANQQSVDKMNEYKERYRGLKAAVGDKEKQLDLAKRTIERLSGQCNAMEVRT